MAKRKIGEIIEETASGFLSENGYELYHVEFVKEGKDLSVWLHYLSSYMGHLDYDSTAYYIHLVPAYFPVNNKGSVIFNQIVPEVRHEVY